MDLQSVNHAWSSKGLQNNFNIYNENFHINDLLFIVEDIEKNIKNLSNFHSNLIYSWK